MYARFIPWAMFFLALILPHTCLSDELFFAEITKVSDGDTFRVRIEDKAIRVRLYGVDCPELKQESGPEARDFAQRLLPLGASVQLRVVNTDRYGRSVAVVILPDGTTLEAALVRSGLAWVDERYCRLPMCEDWRNKEHTARTDGVGLWGSPSPLPPWEWRRITHRR